MSLKNKQGKHLNDSLTLGLTFLFIVGALFLTQLDNPTGRATQSITETQQYSINENFDSDSFIDLNLTNVEKLSITGSFEGDVGSSARVYARTTSGARILIGELDLDEESSSTSSVTGLATGSKNFNSNKPKTPANDNVNDQENELDETEENDTSNKNDVEEDDVSNETDSDEDNKIQETDVEKDDVSQDEQSVENDNEKRELTDDTDDENNTASTTNNVENDSVNNESNIESEEDETVNETEDEIDNSTDELTKDNESIDEESNNSTIENETINNNSSDADLNNTEPILENESSNETRTEEINETEVEPDNNESDSSSDTDSSVDDSQENLSTKIVEFTNDCVNTCDLMGVDIDQIIIEVDEGSNLVLDELVYVHEVVVDESDLDNESEEDIVLVDDVENINLALNESINLNAEDYFIFDNNTMFDAKSSEGYTFKSEDTKLIFTGDEVGEWDAKLYATTGDELVASNTFKITVFDETSNFSDDETLINETETNQTNNETNTTSNETTNETVIEDENVSLENETSLFEDNETVIIEDESNQTNNETNTTSNETTNETELDCNASNPNELPLECLMKSDSFYFPDEELLIENKNAKVVGKFTPIGNLLIKGDFVERTSATPKAKDYQLGHTNNRGEFIPTVWIDSDTGDLHLKGNLVESNSNIVLESGLTAIINKRDILLASINKKTGDMVLRGNIVPYRRSFG